MNVLLVTHGSRGDVQPYLALACGVKAAGHEVTLIGPSVFAELAGSAGVPYVPIVDGPLELLADPVVRRANEDRRGLRGMVRGVRWFHRSRPHYVKVLEDLIAKVKGLPRPDVVVFVPWVPAHHLAEWLKVPAVPVCFQPGWVPTPDFVNPLVPRRLPTSLSRASYAYAEWPVRRLYGSAVARLRRESLGLSGRGSKLSVLSRPDGKPATVLQAFDPGVLPGTPRYPPTTHTTGFWHLPATGEWRMPADLRSFLDAGKRPVYIGFGSMAGSRSAEKSRAVLAAVRQAGVRAVIATGWGGVMAPDDKQGRGVDDVFFVNEMPHEQVFPLMAAIVHHGGAGTTASALRSGRPQVVCPFTFDQPFWARRMHALGLAPAPLPQYDLTAGRLAEALSRVVRDRELAQGAEQFGLRAAAQDGVGKAVEVLETVVESY
ncbi:glycosyl transferase family 1 [Streptomyces albospinus]|uniref:Glycosyl transferase family 1 n=1 Tax=Streptomyces albospinus TaxID=285515 RepID=A0ABQ2VFD9_9ACTN|nr:glycosyltransferase [Streptomyces albospinus]GGU84279.1 glycosyl transferase family 1 [Streptomyces albospinus]